MNELVKATAKVLDFDGVNVSSVPFNSKSMPEGDYVAKIASAWETKNNNGDEMWIFVLALVKHPRISYPWRCTLTPEGLFTLAQLYAAAGRPVPQKRVKADPNKLIGVTIGISLIEDDYQADKGYSASKIDRNGVFPAADVTTRPTAGPAATKRPPGQSMSASDSTESKARSRAVEPAEVNDTELEELELDDL
ncbi:MAG: hypothetical protein ACRDL4_08675 [Thermoleophilaceae bacterium]